MRTIKLTEETRKDLLEKLLKRSPNCYGEYEGRVTEIVNTVRAEGDKALFDYTERFDRAKITVENIRVTEDEIKTAYEEVDPELLSVIRKALVNIRSYHEKQLKQSWFESQPSGIILGQKVQALATVGVYVPGGKAVYPSSVLMNIVPAKVAGVEKIIMCTPCSPEGKVCASTLVAAREAGVDEIYKHLCGSCEKGRLRFREHRLHRRPQRDPGAGGRDCESPFCGCGPSVPGRA